MKISNTDLLGRSRPQQGRILDTMRAEIVSGSLPPAARVPTRRELAERFRISLITVQHALERLAAEGFIVAKGRLGTFVADHPPHLANYAMVFSSRPNQADFSRFCATLERESHGFNSKEQTITPWYGIDGHADNEDFRRLCGEVRSHRVAGLIFPSPPYNLLQTPLLELPDVMRVVLGPSDPERFNSLPAVHFGPMLDRVLEDLVSRGRRRIAIIKGFGLAGPSPEVVQRLGISIRPFMIQNVDLMHPENARALVQLMVRREQDDAPDALVIADDNMVEYATAGVVDAGVRIPYDMEVVAHCNYPWPTPSMVRVRRFGYDVREILRFALQSIDEQRTGQPTIDRTTPLKFEEEFIEPV